MSTGLLDRNTNTTVLITGCHYCELSKFGIFETNRVVHSREVFELFNIGIETVEGFVSLVPIELPVKVRKRDQRDDSFCRGRQCITM